MAWNEPGGGNNDQDPWSGRKKSQNPPDLDKLVKDFQKKVTGLLGGKSGSGSDFNGGSNSGDASGPLLIIIAVLAIVIWAAFGFFIVRPAEQAVVLRFGKYIETVGPGPHWIPPIIKTYYKVNEQQIDTYQYSADMLTQDENIVSVSVAVQYRRANAKDFLFKVVNPIESLQQATASSLRQVIGNKTLNDVMTTGREQVRQDVRKQLTKLLDSYQTGIEITDVALQPAKAPEAVKDAFDDAIKAQEDEQRYINQADAYSKQVIPQANGQAKRLQQEAKAYREQVVLNSRGETARYLALLPEFQQSPEVTRERLYLGALESVLNSTTKVFVDLQNSNNLMYLPLDKLFQNSLHKPQAFNDDPDKAEKVASKVKQSTQATNLRTNRPSYFKPTSRETYAGRGM